MSIHCYLNKKITYTALLFVLFKKKDLLNRNML